MPFRIMPKLAQIIDDGLTFLTFVDIDRIAIAGRCRRIVGFPPQFVTP